MLKIEGGILIHRATVIALFRDLLISQKSADVKKGTAEMQR